MARGTSTVTLVNTSEQGATLVGKVNDTKQKSKNLPSTLDDAVPALPATYREAQDIRDHTLEDPCFTSAVETFKGELSTAFDDVPKLENQGHAAQPFKSQIDGVTSDRGNFPSIEAQSPDDRSHSPQSGRGSSDFDEMITLLPLASHFNISRKSGGSSHKPRRLSADSRDKDNRTIVVEDSKSISPKGLRDSPPAVQHTVEPLPDADTTTPPVATENDNMFQSQHTEEALQPSIMTESPSAQSIGQSRSIETPSIRNVNRPPSAESDLYTSSITDKKLRKSRSLKRPRSIDSNLYSRSITEKTTPKPPASDGSAEQEKVDWAEDHSMLTPNENEQAAQNPSPLEPKVAEEDLPGTDDVQKSPPTLINGRPIPPISSQTAPASLPQSEPSHNDSEFLDDLKPQALRPRSATTEGQTGTSIFKKPNPANDLRRSELMSSDYIKYSHNEHHGLKIILTPDTEAKPKSPVVHSFTAPPSRPAPSVPPLTTTTLSTLSPTNSFILGRRLSNDSAQARYTMNGAVTSSPVEREESINETLSTMSSSDRSDRQSLSSPMTSASNTIATSLSHPPDSLRGQAQSDLHKLQLELSAAKFRGDTSAQKASLQRSMDIIQKTYLSASATKSVESASKLSSPPKGKSNRISLMPKKSMSLLSMVNRKSKQTDLHEAARTGDMDTLTSLLEEKVNPNARGDRFKTLQMEAAIRSHLRCLEVLKAYGADEFAVDAQGRSVLHIAVMFNQPKAVSWLIQAYPPAAPDMPGRKSSRLAWATDAITGSRSSKILREASDGEGSRPLHVAAKLGMAPMVSLLLDNGSDMDAKDNWGRTSLIDAAILNRLNIVELLLDRGADLVAKDVTGMTALHWAAKNNHLRVVEVLLSEGNARFHNENWAFESFNEDGDLALHAAARKGHVEVVKMLNGNRQISRICTKHGETLIHITALANHLPLAKELLHDGAEVNAWAKPHSYHLRLWPDAEAGGFVPTGYSSKALPLPYNIIALHYACTRGYFEMTELLLENGAWVNAVPDDDEHGKSPLMMAVESGSTNLVCLLLARGAKVNAAVPATLMTSLHIACKQGDLETTQELVRYGAKTASRTRDMRTPEELVAKVKDTKKRLGLEAYFGELSRQRYAKIKAQMAENRRPDTTPSLVPQPSPVPGSQHGHFAPYQIPSTQMTTDFIDPENDAFPDAPPAYTPGPRAPQNLAHRPGVHRPQYG